MSFDFLVKDENLHIYRIIVDNDGETEFQRPEGGKIDAWGLFGLAAVGGGDPYIFRNFDDIWFEFLNALEKRQLLDKFLSEVRKNDTEQREWVSSGRWEYIDGYYNDIGHYNEYIYEFTLDDFLGYLGEAIHYYLDEGYGGDSIEIAKLVKAIRNPDKTALEFDLEDEGEWTEFSGNDPGKMWATISRVVSADGVELFQYDADFDREIHDPITFESEIYIEAEDIHRCLIASSNELKEILKTFDLLDKEKELNKKAAKTCPEPEYPESEEEGLWGVYYRYNHYEYDPNTGNFTSEERETVVPYWSKEKAENALELSSHVIDRLGEEDDYHEYYLVKRSTEESDDWEKI